MGEHSRVRLTSLPAEVMSVLREHVTDLDEADVQETLLIRDGQYCGRKLTAAGWTVVWFAEENQLKVYRPDGTLSRAYRPDSPRRAAA